jgi:hypothetical protein
MVGTVAPVGGVDVDSAATQIVMSSTMRDGIERGSSTQPPAATRKKSQRRWKATRMESCSHGQRDCNNAVL